MKDETQHFICFPCRIGKPWCYLRVWVSPSSTYLEHGFDFTPPYIQAMVLFLLPSVSGDRGPGVYVAKRIEAVDSEQLCLVLWRPRKHLSLSLRYPMTSIKKKRNSLNLYQFRNNPCIFNTISDISSSPIFQKIM